MRCVAAGNKHRDCLPAAHRLQHNPSLSRAAEVGLNSPEKLMSRREILLLPRGVTACTDIGLLMNMAYVFAAYST